MRPGVVQRSWTEAVRRWHPPTGPGPRQGAAAGRAAQHTDPTLGCGPTGGAHRPGAPRSPADAPHDGIRPDVRVVSPPDAVRAGSWTDALQWRQLPAAPAPHGVPGGIGHRPAHDPTLGCRPRRALIARRSGVELAKAPRAGIWPGIACDRPRRPSSGTSRCQTPVAQNGLTGPETPLRWREVAQSGVRWGSVVMRWGTLAAGGAVGTRSGAIGPVPVAVPRQHEGDEVRCSPANTG